METCTFNIPMSTNNDFCMYDSVVRMVSGCEGGASDVSGCRFDNAIAPGDLVVESIPFHCILSLIHAV